MKTVYFYFDFVSPYAYIALSQLPRIQREASCQFVFKPILLAGLLNHHGQKGPADIPAKRAYIMRDAFRLCHTMGLPIEGPPAHPFLSLAPLRLCLAVEKEIERQTLASILLTACWGEGKDITDMSVLSDVVRQSGILTDGLLERAQSIAIKEALKQNGQEAIKKGIFGVPTFAVDETFFWGQDRIDLLIEYLNGRGAIDEAKIQEVLSRPRIS